MAVRRFPLLLMLLLGGCEAAGADGLSECLKLAVKPDGSAGLANVCGSRLNVTYCIDNPASAKACSNAALAVTTLFPGAEDVIPGYIDGRLHAAVCVYPEAPVGWTPGPDNPYTCKKTCVMC